MTAPAWSPVDDSTAAFHNRALAEHLIENTDDFSVSTDKKGRNAGRPTRVRRWIGDAA